MRSRPARTAARNRGEAAAPVPVPADGVPAIVAACRSEQADDPEAFAEEYGDEHGREALGRCVKRGIADAKGAAKKERPAPAPADGVPAIVAACRSEQADDPEAFAEEYGDEHGREALGRCVKQGIADAKGAADEDRADDDQADDDQADDDQADDDPADDGDDDEIVVPRR